MGKTQGEIIKTFRGATSMRDFAAQLSVTHASVHLWENDITEPTSDRIADWIGDSRQWVRDMGKALFVTKNKTTIQSIINQNDERN